MCEVHQQTWRRLLEASADLCAVRRARVTEPTGAQALNHIVKTPLHYNRGAEAQYVDIVADLIAEPTRPEQFVKMTDSLPADLAEFYSDEARVLQGGGADPSELRALTSMTRGVGGKRTEYVKYLKREDVQPLWTWRIDGTEKATMGFKAVPKKDGKQRKILPVLPANYLLGPPWRKADLGLRGAASLSSMIVVEDCLLSADFDQENCFTYVQTCEWSQHFVMKKLVAQPSQAYKQALAHWSAPGTSAFQWDARSRWTSSCP